MELGPIEKLLIGGVLITLLRTVRGIWIAYIQRDSEKTVEFRLAADGSRELLLKGFGLKEHRALESKLKDVTRIGQFLKK